MNLFKDARNYIMENDLKVIYLDNKVDVINYGQVISFDNNKIILKNENKTILVVGDNLVVSKLLISEILIVGNITKIEFRWYFE